MALPEFIISHDLRSFPLAASAVSRNITVKRPVGGEIVFSNTYSPGDEAEITGLDKVIENDLEAKGNRYAKYVIGSNTSTVQMSRYGGAGKLIYDAPVIFSPDWLETDSLILNLTAYTTRQLTVDTVKADGTTKTDTKTDIAKIYDVNLKEVAAEPVTFLHVDDGLTVITFGRDNPDFAGARLFRFADQYGYKRYIPLFGMLSQADKTEKTTAYISGRQTVLNSTRTAQFALSIYADKILSELIAQFADSKGAQIWTPDKGFQNIVVDELDDKREMDYTAVTDCTLKFTMADGSTQPPKTIAGGI